MTASAFTATRAVPVTLSRRARSHSQATQNAVK